MKRVAVLQSDYIPWKGYFDIIHDVDEFVFYDDVQFTKNDWRNRNRIIVNRAPIWLTIPTGTSIHQRIKDVRLNNDSWQKKHFKTLEMAYHKAPFWNDYKEWLEYVFLEAKWDYLYELNRYLIKTISVKFLKCTTRFSDSSEYDSKGDKHERLLELVKKCSADIYISGPSARDYIKENDYFDSNITIEWKDYSGYPEYTQLADEYISEVSVLDLLFNVGDDAPYYIWGWRE